VTHAETRKPIDVFISHSSKDRDHATRLACALRVNGLRVWYDEWDLLVGHDIYDSVYEGIWRSQYLAILITQASLQSRWVREELTLARKIAFEEERTVILPLLYEKVDLPAHLSTCKYADFMDFNRGFLQLSRILKPSLTPDTDSVLVLEEMRRYSAQERIDATIGDSREIHSQAAKRLSEPSVLRELESNLLTKDIDPIPGEYMSIAVHLRMSNKPLAVRINCNESIESVVRRLVDILGLPHAHEEKQVGYYLLKDQYPLALSARVDATGLQDGDSVRIGFCVFDVE